MQENKEKIDLKETLGQFFEPDEPDMTQEEAIKKYTEKKSSSNEEEDTSENQEHLERIKKELLASLERVKELEKKIFNDKNIQEKQKIKVDKFKATYGTSLHREKQLEKNEEQERE